MSEHDDLHAQLAQRLFGWTPHTDRVLVDPARPRFGCREFVSWQGPAGEHRLLPPAYTTDPAATAQVWQWVEQQGRVQEISMEYPRTPPEVVCTLYLGAPWTCALIGSGATWPDALCRAALALADALGEGGG